ncbi:MAG: hypothetical protein ACM3ZO_01560 [Clostridia bacterium]
MSKEHKEHMSASSSRRDGRTPPLVVAAMIAVAAIGGAMAWRAIRGIASLHDAAGRVFWAGVVDRVESGKVVVIPQGGAGGAGAPEDEVPRGEVVIPADLLPPVLGEGVVLDFAVTSRPCKTRSRRAYIEALVLRLNVTSHDGPLAP